MRGRNMAPSILVGSVTREETESTEAIEVQSWHAASGVKAVLQGANAPCSAGAETWLSERGVVIFPDFIVNCRGRLRSLLGNAFRDVALCCSPVSGGVAA